MDLRWQGNTDLTDNTRPAGHDKQFNYYCRLVTDVQMLTIGMRALGQIRVGMPLIVKIFIILDN